MKCPYCSSDETRVIDSRPADENTSIRRRIDYDLYYIENWSVGLDIKILFLTIFKGFINKNAY